MKVKCPLGFEHTQPEQSRSEIFVDFSLDVIRDWQQDLPHGHFGAMAKQYYDFLVEFNRTRCQPSNRFEVIEVLLGPIYELLNHIEVHFLQDSSLSSDKKRKIALLVQAICLEVSDTYKLIISQWHKSFRAHKGEILTCLYRLAMLYFDIIKKSYANCAPVPPNIWLEFHAIYQYALKQKLASKTLELHEAFKVRHLTIDNTYKHALLLACTNPYRWTLKELNLLIYALEPWACLLNLAPLKPKNQDVFLVDFNQDMPPRYVHLDMSPSKQSHYLKIEPILQKIFAIQEFHYTKNPTLKLSPLEEKFPLTMTEFLSSAWTQASQRAADRVEKSGQIQFLLGLNAIFKNLLGQDGQTSEQACVSTDEEDEIIFFDKVPLPNVHDDLSPADLMTADLINISPTGVCLEVSDPFPADFKAGQVIALEQPEQPTHLTIGLICWVKQTSQGKARCGIKLLSPNAFAVIGYLHPKQDGPGFKCLWLPREPHFATFHSLLTPLLPFKEDMKVHLRVGQDDYPVLLEKLKDSTSCFNQFSINPQEANQLPFLQSFQPQHIQTLWQSTNLSAE